MIEMIDWFNVSIILEILGSLMAVSVAVVAFWNYLRIRSWKLVVLSMSYAMLAASYVMSYLYSHYSSNFSWIGDFEYGVRIISNLENLLWFIALALLAYIYYSERRARGIKITKLRWVVGGLVIAIILSPMAYIIIYGGSLTFILSNPGQALVDGSVFLLFIGITVLEVYIVASLYSYYKSVKNKNTLIVMSGFVCLLSSQQINMMVWLFYLMLMMNATDVLAVSVLGLAINISGFSLFLVALLRTKGSR
jgi:hypothetical protein